MIRRADKNGTNNTIPVSEAEIYEVFNGDYQPGGVKIKSLFEERSGNQRSVAYMLMSKANHAAADLLEDLQVSLYTQDLTNYVKKNLTSSGVLVIDGIVKFHGCSVYNPNTYDVFLKFYDKATAPTVGTDATIYKIQIPAGGSVILDTTAQIKLTTTLGLGIAATQGYLDTDTAAPATNLEIFLQYKK